MTNTDDRSAPAPRHRRVEQPTAHPTGPHVPYIPRQQGPRQAPQAPYTSPRPMYAPLPPEPWQARQTQQAGPWVPPQQHAPNPPAPAAPRKARKWPWAVGALGLLIVVGSASGGDETPSATPTAQPAAAAAAPAAPAAAPAAVSDTSTGDTGSTYGAQSATFGQQVEAGDVTVTAQKPKERTQEYIGTQYCSSVTLKNTGTSPESFSPFDWKVRTDAGVESSANVPFNADKPLNTGSLRPGGTVTGEVCSDTDTDGVTELVYSPGFGIMHQVTFSE